MRPCSDVGEKFEVSQTQDLIFANEAGRPLDVSTPGELEAVFTRIEQVWGSLDMVVHAIGSRQKRTFKVDFLTVLPKGSLRQWMSHATHSSEWHGLLRR